MHFVASPACGIINRSTALTISSAAALLLLLGPESRLFVPYVNVMNSGWRFFDVILSIVLSGRRACTQALPFSWGISRRTIKCESLTQSRLYQHKQMQLFVKKFSKKLNFSVNFFDQSTLRMYHSGAMLCLQKTFWTAWVQLLYRLHGLLNIRTTVSNVWCKEWKKQMVTEFWQKATSHVTPWLRNELFLSLHAITNDAFCCIHHSRLSLLFSGLDNPKNCPFPWGLSTRLIQSAPKSYLDRFRHLLQGSQTWPTDRPPYPVCTYKLHLAIAVMQPKEQWTMIKNIKIFSITCKSSKTAAYKVTKLRPTKKPVPLTLKGCLPKQLKAEKRRGTHFLVTRLKITKPTKFLVLQT